MQYTLQTIFSHNHTVQPWIKSWFHNCHHLYLTNFHTQCVILLDWKWCKYSTLFLMKFVGFQRFKLLALFNVQSICLSPTLISVMITNTDFTRICDNLYAFMLILEILLWNCLVAKKGDFGGDFKSMVFCMMYHYVQLLMPLSFGACKRGAKCKESQNCTKIRKGCMLVLLDQTNYNCKALKQHFYGTAMNINTLFWTVALEAGDWLFF